MRTIRCRPSTSLITVTVDWLPGVVTGGAVGWFAERTGESDAGWCTKTGVPLVPWRALAATHDAAVQMVDTSIIRVHQHAACIARNERQSMGRSRGGLTSKIHAVVDTNGLPVRLALTTGEAHDDRPRRQTPISLEVGNNAAGRPWL